MRCYLSTAILSLALTAQASATISLPTIAQVPIPAGTLITDGGGATLDNFVSQDLFVNTTNDWTTAVLLIQLDSGSIFQEPEGALGNGLTIGPTDPAGFGSLPSSQFDTYLHSETIDTPFGPRIVINLTGSAGDLVAGSLQSFDTQSINMTWDSSGTEKSDIGEMNLGRFTLSDDATGTWSLAVTEAFNPHVRFVNNPIVNGQMVLSPLNGDLNFDGFVGIEDMNLILGAWNQTVTAFSKPDPSGDGFVGIEDMNIILGNWNAGALPRQPQPPPQINGDFTSDGFVGIDDLNIILSEWNDTVTPFVPPDPSGDGFVGIEDLGVVLGNWNAVFTPPPGAPIPEPAGIAVFSLGLTLVVSQKRCRR